MSLFQLAAVLLAAWLAGCASEGGVVGSGITSSISGNIATVEVRQALVAGAAALLPFPIRVALEEFPGLEATADPADGRFAIRGEFAGAVTVRFSGPRGLLGRLAVDVPAGSEIELADIEIHGQGAESPIRLREMRQRRFFGRAFIVDCTAGRLVIDDDLNHPFPVRLSPATEIRLGSGGAAGSCGQHMRSGVTVLIEGIVHGGPERFIEATVVVIGPSRAPRQGAIGPMSG